LINSGNNNLLYMILKPKYLEPEVEVGIIIAFISGSMAHSITHTTHTHRV